jgi:ABC-2 type transport system permease protein
MIWLVAEREIGSKLRSKAFLISTGVLLLIALAGIVIGGFASKNTSTMPVAVTSETASIVSALPDIEITEAKRRFHRKFKIMAFSDVWHGSSQNLSR